MSNDITTVQGFQQHMTDRLREDVGKLIPDEKLAEMVEQAMQNMFFTRREKHTGGYSSRVEVFPSWWEEEVQKALKERLAKFTENYLNENRETLEKVIRESISEHLHEWMAAAMMDIFTKSTSQMSWTVSSAMEQRLRSAGVIS